MISQNYLCSMYQKQDFMYVV
uniref:Uncharacterized protein n=1 Tax=Rhizophora mucronata TaxID=61149 RepID=A0A2P2PGP4_RHIMU